MIQKTLQVFSREPREQFGPVPLIRALYLECQRTPDGRVPGSRGLMLGATSHLDPIAHSAGELDVSGVPITAGDEIDILVGYENFNSRTAIVMWIFTLPVPPKWIRIFYEPIANLRIRVRDCEDITNHLSRQLVASKVDAEINEVRQMMNAFRRQAKSANAKARSKASAKAKAKSKAKAKGKAKAKSTAASSTDPAPPAADGDVPGEGDHGDFSGEENQQSDSSDGGEFDIFDNEVLDAPDEYWQLQREWFNHAAENEEDVAEDEGLPIVQAATGFTTHLLHPETRERLVTQGHVVSSATGYESCSINCKMHGCRRCVPIRRAPHLSALRQWCKAGMALPRHNQESRDQHEAMLNEILIA